nr:MAG TPA: hypothetical protein [Caudoviricetes sp.]
MDQDFMHHYDLMAMVKSNDNLDVNKKIADISRVLRQTMVVFEKRSQNIILEEIIEMAKRNGITDLYVLNQDFILEAIKEKMERMSLND